MEIVSATDGVHGAIGLQETGGIDFVSFAFCRDIVEHGLGDFFVLRCRAKKRADVCFLEAEQTVAKFSVGCESAAVTGRAEWLADTGNQPNASPAVDEFKVLSRGSGGASQRKQRCV